MDKLWPYVKWEARKRLEQWKRPIALCLAVDLLLYLLPRSLCQQLAGQLPLFVSLLNLLLALAALIPWIFPARAMVMEYRLGAGLLERLSGAGFYARAAAKLMLNLPFTLLFLAQGRLGEALMRKFALAGSWYALKLAAPLPYIMLDCALFIPIAFYFLFLRLGRRDSVLIPSIVSVFLFAPFFFREAPQPSSLVLKAAFCALLLWRARSLEARFLSRAHQLAGF